MRSNITRDHRARLRSGIRLGLGFNDLIQNLLGELSDDTARQFELDRLKLAVFVRFYCDRQTTFGRGRLRMEKLKFLKKMLMHPLEPAAGGDEFHNGGRQFTSQSDPPFQTIAAWVRGE